MVWAGSLAHLMRYSSVGSLAESHEVEGTDEPMQKAFSVQIGHILDKSNTESTRGTEDSLYSDTDSTFRGSQGNMKNGSWPPVIVEPLANESPEHGTRSAPWDPGRLGTGVDSGLDGEKLRGIEKCIKKTVDKLDGFTTTTEKKKSRFEF
ncbi:hypothetical protein EYF80_028224 [Liparis tanakae]|uniref:Uncharacterized protein n=1 Tax=Liparis tanakae TaxID=230148 RepID=A0A4Z2HA06_9TELE|nr:hypothetical protein EYF80_028224 [Liparis tanakae]